MTLDEFVFHLMIGLIFSLTVDGDAVLFDCGWVTILSPTNDFDRRVVQSMEFMLQGN